MPTTAQRAAAYQIACTPLGEFFDENTIRFIMDTSVNEPSVDVAFEHILADALEATINDGAWESWPSGESTILDLDQTREAVLDAFRSRHNPHVEGARRLLERYEPHTLCHGIPFDTFPVGYIDTQQVVETVCAEKPWLWNSKWEATQPAFGEAAAEVYERYVTDLIDVLQDAVTGEQSPDGKKRNPPERLETALLRLAKALHNLNPDVRVQMWCAAHQQNAVDEETGEPTVETGVLKIKGEHPEKVVEFGVRWQDGEGQVVVIPDELRAILEPLEPLRERLRDKELLALLEDWSLSYDKTDMDIEAARRDSFMRKLAAAMHNQGQRAGHAGFHRPDGTGSAPTSFWVTTVGWLTRTFDPIPKPTVGPDIEIDMTVRPFTVSASPAEQ